MNTDFPPPRFPHSLTHLRTPSGNVSPDPATAALQSALSGTAAEVDRALAQLYASSDRLARPGQPTLAEFLQTLRDEMAADRLKDLNRVQQILPDLRGLKLPEVDSSLMSATPEE